jgi:anti-anti-sigma factor
MQITQHPQADLLELQLTGRLDATWADHLSNTIEQAVRSGSHRIVLNMANVRYISSLGVGVLVRQLQLLQSVNGSLSITQPSTPCRTVLTLCGLADFFRIDGAQQSSIKLAASARTLTRPGATYQIFPQQSEQPLSCAFIGNPGKLRSSGFDSEDCHSLNFANGTFGLGLGAFGEGFADCESRFGEFLAAAGCAIALPTTDTNTLPDYVVEQGDFAPRIESLYALYGSGNFPMMVRYDSTGDGLGQIALSEFVDALLEVCDSDLIAFVTIAEAAVLVGASLQRSPASRPISLELPSVRDWLMFTSERQKERSLALIVGVAGRKIPPAASDFLRPMTAGSSVMAHIHAAMFPYRPVQRGELNYSKTIAGVFANSTPSIVLHLMADTRPIEGVGETDLLRGACWAGPLRAITQR